MNARELIGKRVENEHGRVGTITAVSYSSRFVFVTFHDGYEGRPDEGPCMLTMRVEDLEPLASKRKPRRVLLRKRG